MDSTIVAVLIGIITFAVAGIFFLQKNKQPVPAEQAAAVAAFAAVQEGQRAALEDSSDEDDQEEEGAKPSGGALSRLQKKKAEKQAEKERKAQEREMMVEERRKKREEADEKELEEKEQERLAKEAEEAALNELRREKKEREDNEYKQWMGHIEVEEQGVVEVDEEKQKLRRYLREEAPKDKVIILETTARKFDVDVETLVKEIDALLKKQELSGVYDDRGKFVCVTDDEFKTVAKFIKNRGRVSVTELVRECNRIVADADVAEPQS